MSLNNPFIAPSNTEPVLLTKTQVARQLAVCSRTVDNLLKTKSLAFIKIGRAVRIEPSAVAALKAAYRTNAF